MEYQPVIGLEVHAELRTSSKMFCACPVVDLALSEPNIAVCPVCSGMPGVLPVINRKAVEYGLRVALALGCEIPPFSIFSRKNYFYPDLPKGFQISQYEQPLARNGHLTFQTPEGEKAVRIRRVHLEEDTGKLTHITQGEEAFTLVNLNRAGVPLLEIVTEPDLDSAELVRLYAAALRSLLRYLGVNSGDMEKGVLRIEPNISVRLAGSQSLGTRTEIKNLNSFRALERSVAFEIERQKEILQQNQLVLQETRGWDDQRGETVSQRVKEEADDYRYFPEPDLPPLLVDESWLEKIRENLPEFPDAKYKRFKSQYGLNEYDATLLTNELAIADYFEAVLSFVPQASPKLVANWISGEFFGLLNQAGVGIEGSRVSPQALAGLLFIIVQGELNQTTAKTTLAEMFRSGKSAEDIVAELGFRQISDIELIDELINRVIEQNPDQLKTFLSGKESIKQWFFGQVMRSAGGQANTMVVEHELMMKLDRIKHQQNKSE